MRAPRPVDTRPLFGPDRVAFLALLRGLSGEQWERGTACHGWSVKDVALHVLGGDLDNLSRRRDGFGFGPARREGLVDFLNRANEEWVWATRRLSTGVLCDLLEMVGPQLFDHLASLEPETMGSPVSWAGPAPAPVWLDVAREYTERWHHQQHVRDAVGRPGQRARRFLHPVLATFAHALPVALRGLEVREGTAAVLHVGGSAGGDWTVVRLGEEWHLRDGAANQPAVRVSVDQDAAWRLYTKGITVADSGALVEGDRRLGERLLGAIAIIA